MNLNLGYSIGGLGTAAGASLGYTATDVPVKGFPPRYGHNLVTVTSSAPATTWAAAGTSENLSSSLFLKEAFLVFGGITAVDIVNDDSHASGELLPGTEGGADPFLYYLCPTVDM